MPAQIMSTGSWQVFVGSALLRRPANAFCGLVFERAARKKIRRGRNRRPAKSRRNLERTAFCVCVFSSMTESLPSGVDAQSTEGRVLAGFGIQCHTEFTVIDPDSRWIP